MVFHPVVEAQWLPGEWQNHPNQQCNCQHGTDALVMSGVSICMFEPLMKRINFPGYNCNWTPLQFGWCTQYFNCEMRCFCEAERWPFDNDWRSLAKATFVGRRAVSGKTLVFDYFDEDNNDACPLWHFYEWSEETGHGQTYCMQHRGWWDFPPNKLWPGDPIADLDMPDRYADTNGVGSGPGGGWSQGPAFTAEHYGVSKSRIAHLRTPQAKLRRRQQKAKAAFEALESDDPNINKEFIKQMIKFHNLTRPTPQELTELLLH